jgi:hypothetical protein
VLFGSFRYGRWITPAHPVLTDDGVLFQHGIVLTATTDACSGWTGTDYVLRGTYRTLRLQVGVPAVDRSAPQASSVIVTGGTTPSRMTVLWRSPLIRAGMITTPTTTIPLPAHDPVIGVHAALHSTLPTCGELLAPQSTYGLLIGQLALTR